MTTAIEEVVDNPDLGAEAQGATHATGALPTDEGAVAVVTDDKGKPGKFKSLDEAERAHSELQKKLGVQGSELGELRKELERSQERAALADKLDAIAENTRKPDGEQDAFDAYVHSYAEKYGRSEDEVRDMLGTAGSWVSKARQEMRDELKREQEAVRKEIATLRDQQERLAPDYLENRAEVDRIQKEYGVPLSVAKGIAAEIREKSGAATERLTPPGGGGNGRLTKREPAVKPDFSDEEWKRYQAEYPELTDEDRKTLERERARAREASKAKPRED